MPPPFDLLPQLLQGLWITVQVYAGGIVFAVVTAMIVGLLRLAPWRPVRWTALVYVQAFRGFPALVLLYWLYYVMPGFGVTLSALTVGIVALGLNYGAYGAEIVRGAVQSIPHGQTEAAIALNLTRAQRMRRIILPQAVVRMLPPMGNLNIELLKNTALVYFISLQDVTYQSKTLQTYTQRTVEIFSLALVLYFLLAMVVIVAVRRIERIIGRGMRAGGVHGA